MNLRSIFLTLSVIASAATASAQVVHPDKTVTFSLDAPHARSVKVNAQFAPKTDMVKGENGIWSVTLGPVTPDIYPYSFEVDGTGMMDPQCPDWFPNEGFKHSMVEIPGNTPMDHELRQVPHGKVDYVNYYSQNLGTYGSAVIYTPPAYDSNSDSRYPVFYLISGTTDTEEVYFKVGKMNLILDNLIAEGKAKAQAIHDMIKGEVSPACPASILQKHDNVHIFIDNDAASLL